MLSLERKVHEVPQSATLKTTPKKRTDRSKSDGRRDSGNIDAANLGDLMSTARQFLQRLLWP